MLIVTIDLDWACEPAIDYTLRVMEELQVPVTVFATHRSAAVESRAENLEVGLHPYFGGNDSSHGSTIQQVVEHVMGIPHNLKAFRCHRFAGSNETDTAMLDAGMTISSNVCTDLEMIPPFRNRSGLLEVPIFMEDGGYLHRGHSLRGPTNSGDEVGEELSGASRLATGGYMKRLHRFPHETPRERIRPDLARRIASPPYLRKPSQPQESRLESREVTHAQA